MDGTTRFTVDSSKVVHETVDGEAILVHLETGSYYSLAGTGAALWTLAVRAHSRDEIAEVLASAYGEPRPAVVEGVTTLLSQLLQEGLLEPNGAHAPAGPTEVDGLAMTGGFEAPKLVRYDDMQEYLLVDPIHQVDNTGWPSTRAE